MRAKELLRRGLTAPGVRHGLRYFISHPNVPRPWRQLAYRKLAKRAQFAPSDTFEYVTADGVRLELVHSGALNHLYWCNEYEPETMELFFRLVKGSQTILDIGAANGVFSILAAATNPQARIVAFEPGHQAAGVFAANIAMNPTTTQNIELHRLALGDHDAAGTLYVSGRFGGTSSLDPSFRPNAKGQAVEVQRGDRVMSELGIARVDLIKIDTETTEPAVFSGLIETLRRDRPGIICEVLAGRTERALEALLGPLGYRYYWLADGGPTLMSRIEGDRTYRFPNYFFTATDLGQLP